MAKNILVIGKGDTVYSDRNRLRVVEHARRNNYIVQACDYSEINSLSDFTSKLINVLFFFPFTFWNKYCEIPNDTQLYGTSRKMYDLFSKLFEDTRKELENKYDKKRLKYIIKPHNAPVDRDKIETIRRLRLNQVPTSEPIEYNSLQDIIANIDEHRGVYIKCRYGAEGKGITVLKHKQWLTNYRVENNTLTNYGVYDKWPFIDITDRKDLLEQLLENEIIVEREIITPKSYDKKFDIRVYVIKQKIPHLFMRSNAHENIVTNYSQGASIRHHPNTGLDQPILDYISRVALHAARALKSDFLGVDIIFDSDFDHPKVIEVQTFTDFPSSDNFNIVKYILSDNSGLFK